MDYLNHCERLPITLKRCSDNIAAILKVIKMINITDATVKDILGAVCELKEVAGIMEEKIKSCAAYQMNKELS
jgi:hypothetical protein